MIVSPICEMLGIKYPIFQGGMAWIADGKLAAAVSNGGGLGIISAMNAGGDYLREQIRIARSLTDKPFGVNIMLMSPHVQEVAKIVAEEKVAVVTTGAGIPNQYVPMWKEAGIKVIPVAASVAAAKMMASPAVISASFPPCPWFPRWQMRWISLYWRQAASATAEGWQRHLCWAQLACRWALVSCLQRNVVCIRIIRIW